jgi:hypothetical protein
VGFFVDWRTWVWWRELWYLWFRFRLNFSDLCSSYGWMDVGRYFHCVSSLRLLLIYTRYDEVTISVAQGVPSFIR